ncbi:MAG: four helix bundle protein, partial [Lentisphaeria bacterium]|nr:four helix bundle protein [Lentisphaeria bacterium]
KWKRKMISPNSVSNTEHPITKWKRKMISPNSVSNTEHPNSNGRRFDLQDRLIDYAINVIKLSEELPPTQTGKHISGQLLRSGTSPAPNYGEAQSAESHADFIHKLKIALKELRETHIWLKIILRAKMFQSVEQLDSLILETDELMAILFKCIDTAKRNKTKKANVNPWADRA